MGINASSQNPPQLVLYASYNRHFNLLALAPAPQQLKKSYGLAPPTMPPTEAPLTHVQNTALQKAGDSNTVQWHLMN